MAAREQMPGELRALVIIRELRDVITPECPEEYPAALAIAYRRNTLAELKLTGDGGDLLTWHASPQ